MTAGASSRRQYLRDCLETGTMGYSTIWSLTAESAVNRKKEYRKTIVKAGASLGANSTIICGVTIGEYAFIGAGALVNSDIKPFALMVGVPAKQIGWISQFGERLDLPLAGSAEAYCSATKLKYLLINGNCRRSS